MSVSERAAIPSSPPLFGFVFLLVICVLASVSLGVLYGLSLMRTQRPEDSKTPKMKFKTTAPPCRLPFSFYNHSSITYSNIGFVIVLEFRICAFSNYPSC